MSIGGVTSKTSRMTEAMKGITMMARMIPAESRPMPTGGPEKSSPSSGTPLNTACSGWWTYCERMGLNTRRPHMP